MPAKALLFDVFGTCVDWFSRVSSTLLKLADELNSDADINAITQVWHHLAPWADARKGLAMLQKQS